MNKKFETPSIEVRTLSVEDIITASSPEENEFNATWGVTSGDSAISD